jgi:hypothetical protein
MSVKPIFTVGIPFQNPEYSKDIAKNLGKKMKDYHILVYSLQDKDADVTFNAFYEKPITDIEFEELKLLVLKELKK